MQVLFATDRMVLDLHPGCVHGKDPCNVCQITLGELKTMGLLKNMLFLIMFDNASPVYVICDRIALSMESGFLACFDQGDPLRTIRVPLTALRSISVASKQDPFQEGDDED